MTIRSLWLIAHLSISGCCFAPVPIPSAPRAPAPVGAGPTLPEPSMPTLDLAPPDPPSVVPPIAAASDPFDVDALGFAQLRNLRALFDGARPQEGSLASTVLVCATIVRGSGYDDSFFAGGPDVALEMRLGTGPVRGTPQSPQRIYSMPAPSLAAGDTVWIRVVDRDVFFDDLIAEGSARYERVPFTLTMGQADVECRALDAARVDRGAHAALEDLARAITRLPSHAPDLSASDLGYPATQASAVMSAAEDVAAWTGPSDRRLVDALEPAHAWVRTWRSDVQSAVASASSTLPAPTTVVQDGASALSMTQVVCEYEAMALRAQIGEANSPSASSSGCIALLHIEHAPARTLAHGSSSGAAWALDPDGRIIGATVTAIRVGAEWRSLEVTQHVSGTYDVAFALENGDARLLRVGAPFAHAQLMRLR